MLHFNGLEPIDFRGTECAIKADEELKLRLQAVKLSDADANSKLTDLLVQCFEEDYAKQFIREKLSFDDKIVISAYITGGETALNRMSKATDGAVEAYITRSVEGANNG